MNFFDILNFTIKKMNSGQEMTTGGGSDDALFTPLNESNESEALNLETIRLLIPVCNVSAI